MISRLKDTLNFILTFFCLFFLIGFAHSQSNLEKKIDVQFENTSLVRAIKMISKSAEVNFTYNPSIIPDKPINKSFKEQSIRFILTDILAGLEISFVEISGQIILYRSNEGFGFIPKQINVPLEVSGVEEEDIILKGTSVHFGKKPLIPDDDTIVIHHYDTIYLTKYDTVVQIQKDTLIVETLKVDTIVLLDTATIFDKIYTEKAKNKFKPWLSTELLYSWQPNINYTITENDNLLFSESLSERINISRIQGYSVAARLNIQFTRFLIQTGLGLNQLTQHFEHINESFSGYNRTDTIETYYTIQATDTNWFYITEDKWIETSEIIRNITKANSQTLQIPLILGYSKRVKNFSFELCAGLYTEIPLQREISVYFDTTNFAVSEENNINNLRFKTQSPTFSYSVSLSINYLLNKNLCMVVSPYYYSNITSIYRKGEALQQKNNYLSFYIGLRYYFKTNPNNKRF